jgi:hypothetical protein
MFQEHTALARIEDRRRKRPIRHGLIADNAAEFVGWL